MILFSIDAACYHTNEQNFPKAVAINLFQTLRNSISSQNSENWIFLNNFQLETHYCVIHMHIYLSLTGLFSHSTLSQDSQKIKGR